MHTFVTKKGTFINHDGILEGGNVKLSALEYEHWANPNSQDGRRGDKPGYRDLYFFNVEADDLIELVVKRSNKKLLYEAVMRRLLEDD